MGSLIAFAGAISLMENQIKVMNENLAALKSAKLPNHRSDLFLRHTALPCHKDLFPVLSFEDFFYTSPTEH